MPEMKVYIARFHKDKLLRNEFTLPEWIIPLQVGAALTKERIADIADCDGENISQKNANYCELTGLYWIWKNAMKIYDCKGYVNYYGMFHYRRILDFQNEDIEHLYENNIDVILPFPTIHEPDISEHHTRYIKEEDWNAMLLALEELQPAYAKALPKIFNQPYFINYNLIIAKSNVLTDYCNWLFPILERIEELSDPKSSERADRYIGYLGENLMTLYFLYNYKSLNIYHTGRLMLI